MKFKHPEVNDMLRANKVVKRLQSMNVELRFPSLGDVQNWYFLVMSDAAFANLSDDVSSGGGHVILLVGEHEQSSVISWKANKIRRVIRSTMAAEALALEEALEHTIFVRALLMEMMFLNSRMPIESWIDSENAFKGLNSTHSVSDQKLKIDIACIKENIANENVVLRKCPGQEMIANSLTKRGANSEHLIQILTNGTIKNHFKDGRISGLIFLKKD